MAKKSAPSKAKPAAKGKDTTPKAGTADYHRMQADRHSAMSDIHRGKARMLEAGKKKDPYCY